MRFDSKTILITQLRLKDYAGSEIVTLELSEHFSAQGATVYVATDFSGEPVMSEFKSLKNVHVVKSNDTKLNELIDQGRIDIAWIHHQEIPEALLRNPGKTVFFFHHMSPYSPLEQPVFYEIESSLASAVLFNSKESLEAIEQQGYLDEIPIKNKIVFNNPAPDFYFNKQESTPELRNILVVSNHVPDELAQSVEKLRNTGYKVDVVGDQGDRYMRILPETLVGADVVVTIGKTVQYALLAHKPVYVYDRFGGPGYLNGENFNKASDLNFSGRGFNTRTSEQITKDIISGYQDACHFFQNIDSDTIDRYRLSTRIEDLFSRFASGSRTHQQIKHQNIQAYLTIKATIKQYLVSSVRSTNIPAYKQKINQQELKITKLTHQLDEMQNSKAFKVLSRIRAVKYRLTHGLFEAETNDFGMSDYVSDFGQENGEIVGQTYPVTHKKNALRIAVIARGVQTQPTSSLFIRLVGPLSYKRNAKKFHVRYYPENTYNLDDVDVCIVQRTAFDSVENVQQLVNNLFTTKTALIVDTDDMFEEMDTHHPEFRLYKDRIEAYNLLLEKANKIWVSTDVIAKKYKRKTLIENSVDTRLWRVKKPLKRQKNEALKVVYMGTKTHQNDLLSIIDSLDSLSEKSLIQTSAIGVGQDVESLTNSIHAIQVPKNSIIYPSFVRWFQDYADFHVGIAPLVNNKFNDAKSDIKLTDYILSGIYPIASSFGPYKRSTLKKYITTFSTKNLEGAIKNTLSDAKINKRVEDAQSYVLRNRHIRKAAKQQARDINQVLKEIN